MQLGDHAAGSKLRAFVARERENTRVDDRDGLNELGIRVTARVTVIQAVDVREQDQQIRRDGRRYDCRERIVVADDDLIRGDRVVLVDDRQCAELKQARERIVKVRLAATALGQIRRGDEQLRHDVIILRKQLVVNIHQLTLPDRGRSLLGGHVLRPRGQAQLADAHADRAG